MDCKLENLLIALDDEIDKKCLELKKKKQEQRNTRLFVYTCILFIMIPIILIFAGINIVAILFPIVCFFAISMFILSPIILGNNVRGVIQ
jgi:predicted nucleic acid-binding Zn ribbon protein